MFADILRAYQSFLSSANELSRTAAMYNFVVADLFRLHIYIFIQFYNSNQKFSTNARLAYFLPYFGSKSQFF